MSELKTAAEIAMAGVSVTDAHPIPPMTAPMGKYWRQPDRMRIEVDATHAMMTKEDFDALSNYSLTTPTGVYPGKMWRRLQGEQWWLCWFGVHATEPELYCSNHYRKILIID